MEGINISIEAEQIEFASFLWKRWISLLFCVEINSFSCARLNHAQTFLIMLEIARANWRKTASNGWCMGFPMNFQEHGKMSSLGYQETLVSTVFQVYHCRNTVSSS